MATTRANTRTNLLNLIANAQANPQLQNNLNTANTSLLNAKKTLLDYDLLMYQIEKKKDLTFGAVGALARGNNDDAGYENAIITTDNNNAGALAIRTSRETWIRGYFNIVAVDDRRNDPNPNDVGNNFPGVVDDRGVQIDNLLAVGGPAPYTTLSSYLRFLFDSRGLEGALIDNVNEQVINNLINRYGQHLFNLGTGPIPITTGGNNEVNVNRLPTSLKRRYSEIMNRINNLENLVGGRRNKKSRSRSRSNSRKQNGGKKSPSKTVKRVSPKKRSPKRK